MFLMAALFVGPYLLLVSDAIPAFDVKQSCRGAETTGMAGRTIQMCIDSERATRDQLKKSWSEFNADDKALCMKMIKSGVLRAMPNSFHALRRSETSERYTR